MLFLFFYTYVWYILKNGVIKMKKILVIIISIILLCGCSHNSEKLELSGINPIKYEKLIQCLNKDVTFLLYIGRDDCGDCVEFYPILEDYINEHEDTGLYYLNIKEYRDAARKDDATSEEIEFYENIYKTLEIEWTPTIHVIRNGKIIDTYQYLDEDYINIEDREKQKEKRNEYIEEFNIFMDNYFKE